MGQWQCVGGKQHCMDVESDVRNFETDGAGSPQINVSAPETWLADFHYLGEAWSTAKCNLDTRPKAMIQPGSFLRLHGRMLSVRGPRNSRVPTQAQTGHADNPRQSSKQKSITARVPLDSLYQVRPRNLGWGSFGQVSIATHMRTGVTRAMKAIRNDKKNFTQREPTILSNVDHPNVVRLYELFDEGSHFKLIMELCSGRSLGERIDRKRSANKVEEHDAMQIMWQALSAVHHLHSLGIVHRDLKPENLVFVEPDNMKSIKLVDFGLSRWMDPQSEVRLTPRIGTEPYIAPEHYIGQLHKELVARADIFSLGGVLVAMLEASLPARITEGCCWNSDMSPDCHDLLGKLLRESPVERASAGDAMSHPWFKNYGSCEDLSSAIDGMCCNFELYAMTSPFRRLALVAIAREVADVDAGSAKKLYRALEFECNDVLTRQAISDCDCVSTPLRSVIECLGRYFDEIDVDGSGFIDWSEFLAVALASLDRIWPSDHPVTAENSGGWKPVLREDACLRAFDMLSGGTASITVMSLHGLLRPAMVEIAKSPAGIGGGLPPGISLDRGVREDSFKTLLLEIARCEI